MVISRYEVNCVLPIIVGDPLLWLKSMCFAVVFWSVLQSFVL